MAARPCCAPRVMTAVTQHLFSASLSIRSERLTPPWIGRNAGKLRRLSDQRLALTEALPTFRNGEWTLLKRFSLILEGSCIVHVIYPVFPSNADAPAVTAWLRARGE